MNAVAGKRRPSDSLVIFDLQGVTLSRFQIAWWRSVPDASEIGFGLGATRSGPAKAPLRFAGLVLDLEACTLARESGETITLTRGELALLRLFVTQPGRVLSRDTVL
jgi:DNA-binding response OmpR family regulator